MSFQVYDERVLEYWRVKLENGDGTGPKDFATGDFPNGSRVDVLIAVSDDTSDHDLLFSISDGSVSYPYQTVQVPAGSGTGVIPAVDVLAAILPANQALYLAANFILQASVPVAVTSGKVLRVHAWGGDF